MSGTSNKTRLEHDCIGQMEVPANVYLGYSHPARYRQLPGLRHHRCARNIPS